MMNVRGLGTFCAFDLLSSKMRDEFLETAVANGKIFLHSTAETPSVGKLWC